MKLKALALAAAVLVSALALVVPSASAETSGVQTIFTPTASAGFVDPGVMYARPITLHYNGTANGTMLTTFETYTNGTPYFPVYKSTNGGSTWSYLSQVDDTVNDYGMRWNPDIYELPAALGNLPAGTLIEAGLSVPSDLASTTILLFDSTNQGASWSYLSTVAVGGEAIASDPYTPVWEPFLLMYDGSLIVYYSDQREDSTHSQLLDHQTSTNGTTWSSVADDVVYPAQAARPGMATVAEIGGGQWIMTYEYCGLVSTGCPAYYKIASSPLDFGAATGKPITLNDGSSFADQPYVTWTPSGGADGTIVVSCGGQTALAVSTNDGTTWKSEASNAPGGYSRSLMVMPDGNTVMTLTGGFHNSDYLNQVQFAFDNVAPGISDGATYTLTNSYSSLGLGASGTSVLQESTPADWVLTRQADGYFTVTDAADGLKLTVNGGSLSNGAAISLASAAAGSNGFAGSAAQDWSVVQQSNGTFTLANRGSGLLLDDYEFGKTSGSEVDQWASTGGSNQDWTLTQAAFPTLTSGIYSIQNNYNEYLEIPAGSTTAGTQADQWWYANQSWHLWTFTAVTGGYQIVNHESGLVLTDTYPASGEAITQAAAVSGNADQVWTLVPNGSDFLIKNAGTGRFITIAQGSSADLANAVSWTQLNTPDQLWTVRLIDAT